MLAKQRLRRGVDPRQRNFKKKNARMLLENAIVCCPLRNVASILKTLKGNKQLLLEFSTILKPQTSLLLSFFNYWFFSAFKKEHFNTFDSWNL